MCGILFYTLNSGKIFAERGKNRGPDSTKKIYLKNYGEFVFHRLSINGEDLLSNQPFDFFIGGKHYICMCNGEIFNYKEIYEEFEIEPYTSSDCEVIIWLFIKFGSIQKVCEILYGEYSFVLFESSDKINYNIHIGRDHIGNQSLYYRFIPKNDNQEFGLIITSEMKMIENCSDISHFPPGCFAKITPFDINFSKYCSYPQINTDYSFTELDLNSKHKIITFHAKNINKLLNDEVRMRIYCSDERIIFGSLLSGGLDSYGITLVANKYHKERFGVPIQSFAIGLKGSEDLKFARKAAKQIGTRHHEFVVSKEEVYSYLKHIPDIIESPCITTNRASLMNFLVCLKMDETEFPPQIVFNGDVSDELFGGYLYFLKSPNNITYDMAIREALERLHYYDLLRSNKTISSTGKEGRTPYSGKRLVDYVCSVPADIRRYVPKEGNGSGKNQTKYLLRKAIELEGDTEDEILWRVKEAFSDGVSSDEEPFFLTLQKYIVENFSSDYQLFDEDMKQIMIKNESFLRDEEEKFYLNTFNSKYHGSNILPHGKWMPLFVNAVDPSAKTLDFY